MSETPARIRRGPVRLGQDNEYVYKHILQIPQAPLKAGIFASANWTSDNKVS